MTARLGCFRVPLAEKYATVGNQPVEHTRVDIVLATVVWDIQPVDVANVGKLECTFQCLHTGVACEQKFLAFVKEKADHAAVFSAEVVSSSSITASGLRSASVNFTIDSSSSTRSFSTKTPSDLREFRQQLSVVFPRRPEDKQPACGETSERLTAGNPSGIHKLKEVSTLPHRLLDFLGRSPSTPLEAGPDAAQVDMVPGVVNQTRPTLIFFTTVNKPPMWSPSGWVQITASIHFCVVC